jgi:hypothetical protein
MGKSKRTNKVTVGGDKKKDTIYVNGLEEKEFVIERRDDRVVILDGQTGLVKATFSDRAPSIVATSVSSVTLRVGLEDKLKC